MKHKFLLLSHPEISKSFVTGSYIPYLFDNEDTELMNVTAALLTYTHSNNKDADNEDADN